MLNVPSGILKTVKCFQKVLLNPSFILENERYRRSTCCMAFAMSFPCSASVNYREVGRKWPCISHGWDGIRLHQRIPPPLELAHTDILKHAERINIRMHSTHSLSHTDTPSFSLSHTHIHNHRQKVYYFLCCTKKKQDGFNVVFRGCVPVFRE